MSKQDWVWMPHAGHLIVGRWCRFHLNTYVNGYIVSTVGEYWPDSDVRRILAENRGMWPKLTVNVDGKVVEDVDITPKLRAQVLSLKGDAFDDAYLKVFGYEELGMDRKYETMVFTAKDASEASCCPWRPNNWDNIDFDGYNEPEDAFRGHLAMCEKWDKEVHGKEYKHEQDNT